MFELPTPHLARTAMIASLGLLIASCDGSSGADASFATSPTTAGSGDGPPVNECAAPKPEWIWCDDFEEDRIASYFEASMPIEDGVGLDGSRAAVGRYLLGSSEAGNLKVAFGRTPGAGIVPTDEGTENYREIYWRKYLKHPSDWQGAGADKLSRATVFTGGNWQQAMIAHAWSGQGSDDVYLKIDPARGTDEAGNIVTTQYNDFANLQWLGARHGDKPTFVPERFGVWQCIEARVKLNDPGQSNGIFELWIDGELSTSRTDLNLVGNYNDYGINAVFLENYWNDTSPVEQERYMDNFVVSTAPIGCG